MKSLLNRSIILLGIFFSFTCGAAAVETDPFNTGLSLQGYSGVLNVPSAYVTEEGWLHAIYSNQQESRWRQRTPSQDNYLFSIGLFNFLELGGRFFEAPGVGRDLSATVKLSSAALTRDYPFVPVIAVGAQDPNGGAVFLKTSYLVLSEDIWRLRLSAGYGSGPDRMKGLFAGGEFKAFEWLYLLGEYDTAETNVGARLTLPPFRSLPLSFTATAKTSLDYRPGRFEVAFGVSMPLDFRVRKKEAAPITKAEPAEAEILSQKAGMVVQPGPEPKIQHIKSNFAETLRDRLISAGFLGVRVGTLERALVVEYENTIFNHNELDALGVVAGLAAEAAPESFDTLRLVVKRRNIRMGAITLPLQQLRNFMTSGTGVRDLRDLLLFDAAAPEESATVFSGGDENPVLFTTSLLLAPGLTTFIGTEVGVFDYLLSLKPELTTALWKGAALTARADLPISWSDNLDDGKHYRSSRQGAQLDRLMLFQGVKPLADLMFSFGAGLVVHDRYGMLNEAIWSPGDGGHRFRISQGWNSDATTHHHADLLLGSYRYYYPPLDLSLEGTVGQFWAEDRGVSLELKRFWEDTAVSLYAKSTKGSDDKKWQAIGLQFTFPLTPRRDMKPLAKLQLRGSDEWGYAQETTLKNNNPAGARGNTNYLAPYPLAVNPLTSQALYRVYYNRDRLSASYLRSHLERLREAWLKYKYAISVNKSGNSFQISTKVQ